MAGFIDFIADASKKTDLSQELQKHLYAADSQSLQAWFESKGYTLSSEECEKLIRNKDFTRETRAAIWY